MRLVPSCQRLIYSPPTALGAAGTAPTSHRRRPKHGAAEEVTIVPAFSCFKLECLDGSFRCGSGADITANLWSAPRPHTCATHRRRPRPRASPPPAPPAARAAPLPPTVYHPYPSRPRSHRRSPAPTAAPPSLLQVGADCAAHPNARCVTSQATLSVGTHRATWLHTLGYRTQFEGDIAARRRAAFESLGAHEATAARSSRCCRCCRPRRGDNSHCRGAQEAGMSSMRT